MKTHVFRVCKIIFCIVVAFAFWGCGDPPEKTKKDVSVRKKVVLPPESPTQSVEPDASKPIEAEPPAAVEVNEETSPKRIEPPDQEIAVTKKIPDIADKSEIPEDTIEVEAKPAEPTPEPVEPMLSERKETDLKADLQDKPVEKSETLEIAKGTADEIVKAVNEPGDLSALETSEPSALGEPGDEGPVESTQEPEAPAAEGSEISDTGVSESALASILGITKQEKKKVTGYDAAGKVDPFEPLFKEQEEPPPEEESPNEENATAEKPKREKRIPRTPLEKMDLNQLKLVGVIRAESGNRALVEEASGKGYIISKGTYIGIHSGKVAEILKDRVVVEEEYEDIRGEVTVRKRELKIEKPPGEGYHEM